MTWDSARILVLSWWEAGGWTQAALIFVVGWALSHVVRWTFQFVVARIARHTSTGLDDTLVDIVRRPVGWTVQAAAAWLAISELNPGSTVEWIVGGVLGSAVIVVWTLSATRSSAAILDHLVRHSDHYTFVNVRTMPAFEFAANVFIYGGTAFMLCEAWDINTTGWLASAGVVGIAVGFASQDTLANLVAGVAILADAPYKLGDFLELETGMRGRVSEIGVRTTRLVTNSGVEIIVPNSVMASSRITNQSGGPSINYRIAVDVSVGYGVDVEQVKQLIVRTALGTPGVISDPRPMAFFRAMGDNGLLFSVRVWISEPRIQDPVIDELNTRIYKALRAADIEIPFPKRDVYVHHADQ